MNDVPRELDVRGGLAGLTTAPDNGSGAHLVMRCPPDRKWTWEVEVEVLRNQTNRVPLLRPRNKNHFDSGLASTSHRIFLSSIPIPHPAIKADAQHDRGAANLRSVSACRSQQAKGDA